MSPVPAEFSGKRSAAARAARSARASQAAMPDRVIGIGLAMLALYGALAGRLFYIQVLHHEEFMNEARKQRNRAVALPARRGLLLDRNGSLLVRNQPAVDIVIDPNFWHYHNGPAAGDSAEARQERAISTLAQIAPEANIPAAVAKHGITMQPDGKRWRSFTVAEKLDPSVADKIKDAKLSGVAAIPTTRRTAIDGSLAPHVIGFTGRDGKGLDGLENGLNDNLAGENGILKAEFDVKGRTIPGSVQQENSAKDGRDVVLTIDAGIQNIVQNALKNAFDQRHAEAATAVVLDVKSGDILACANYPTYDVNNRGTAPVEARVDRAVSTPYEPGSTLKIITVGAALEEKKVTPQTRFQCSGSLPIGKKAIHCHPDNAFPHGHGDESLEDVIVHSCNVATADCAFRLGKEKLFEYESAFGFGARTGSGLPGESRGRLKPSDSWSDMQLANIAFGQGISVTPLQLAAAYAAIADGGVYHKPHIVRGVRDTTTQAIKVDPADPGRRVLSPETSQELRTMLQAVVDRGTGKNAALDGYTAGGKTGTAQIAEKGKYSGKFVASFIGMAPMNDPKYVVLVAVTDPQGEHMGAFVSAPVFREITQNILLTQRVPHDKALTPKTAKTGVAAGAITHDD